MVEELESGDSKWEGTWVGGCSLLVRVMDVTVESFAVGKGRLDQQERVKEGEAARWWDVVDGQFWLFMVRHCVVDVSGVVFGVSELASISRISILRWACGQDGHAVAGCGGGGFVWGSRCG